MRRLTAVLALAILVVLAVASSAKLDVEQATTGHVITDAFERGVIDRAEMYLLKAYSVYAPELVPDEYVGGVIEKCGLPTIEELESVLSTLPEEVAGEIRGLRARPSCMTYVETTHFRIHYDTSGAHKIYGWPDTSFRDDIMTAAETSWTEEVDVMGFRSPPPDGSDPDGGGGNDLYDIYVQDLGAGLFGYCQATYYAPGGPANDATSFVVMNHDFSGFGHTQTECIQITVAHEFCHGLQAAHDVNEPTWYKECTSVWAEELVYDSVNDYTGYINYYYNSPYQSLDYNPAGGMRWYGTCVWNFYLSENVHEDVIVENWWEMETSSEYVAMNNVLLARGTSLAEEFHEFAIWNFFTNARYDGGHYEEGQFFPLNATSRTFSMYPISDVGPYTAMRPDAMAYNLIKFSNPGNGWTGLHLSFDGPSLAMLDYWTDLCVRDDIFGSGGTHHLGEISLNPWGNGDTTVAGWDTLDYIMMIVVNGSTNYDDMEYLFSAEQVDTGVDDIDAHVFALKPASPNPFTAGTSISYSIQNGGGAVEMTIYDINGREVRTLVNEQMAAGDKLAYWDGMDNTGGKVASGVYFARLNVDGLTAFGKLVVLK